MVAAIFGPPATSQPAATPAITCPTGDGMDQKLSAISYQLSAISSQLSAGPQTLAETANSRAAEQSGNCSVRVRGAKVQIPRKLPPINMIIAYTLQIFA
jgi:hypothetical protein